MKQRRKFLSILLAIVMLLSVFPVGAIAADDGVQTTVSADIDPVIVVRGFDFTGLVHADGTKTLQLNAGGIIKVLFSYFISKLTFNESVFTDALLDFANTTLAPIASDKNGDSVLAGIGAKTYPLPLDNNPDEIATWDENAIALARSFVDTRGAGNAFLFTFDWRKNPLVIADELNAFIKNVKSMTNKDKIDIVGTSMGGMVTTAYIYKYGCESIDNLTYNCSAHNGVQLVGSALSGNISIDGTILKTTMNAVAENQNAFVRFLLKAADAVGLYDGVADCVGDFVSENKNRLYDEALKDTLCTALGLWGMCPDAYFDDAVEFLFADDADEYVGFLTALEDVREFVFSTEKILATIADSDVKLAFVTNYGRTSLPLHEKVYLQTDGVIEAVQCSNGATFAPVGEVLSEAYLASADPKYISPDKIVDASTALYPDCTWFVKNVKHVGCAYGSEHSAFIMWLTSQETQINANECEQYPQFLVCDENQKFVK